MNNHVKLGLLIAAALTIVACNAGAPATPSASPTAAPAGLDGRTFLSTSVRVGEAAHELAPDTRISLSFASGNLSANAGCNSLSGAYTVEGDKLVVGQMAMTQMACDEPRMAQDQWLSTFLTSGPTITLNGNDLTLANDTTTMTLIDSSVAEPDPALVGTVWTLDSIIAGSTVSSVVDGVTSTLQFNADGTVNVLPGCNTGSTDYTVEGQTIDFGPIALTRMACDGPAGQVESDVLAVLDSGPLTFGIASGVLTLQGTDSGLMYTAQ